MCVHCHLGPPCSRGRANVWAHTVLHDAATRHHGRAAHARGPHYPFRLGCSVQPSRAGLLQAAQLSSPGDPADSWQAGPSAVSPGGPCCSLVCRPAQRKPWGLGPGFAWWLISGRGTCALSKAIHWGVASFAVWTEGLYKTLSGRRHSHLGLKESGRGDEEVGFFSGKSVKTWKWSLGALLNTFRRTLGSSLSFSGPQCLHLKCGKVDLHQ